VQDLGAGLGLPALEHDAVGLDPPHTAEPDDIPDLPQCV
jgi:hypothetical protein